MANKKLDTTKDYGTVHGDFHGARYEQGGVLFDVHGDEIVIGGEKPKRGGKKEEAAAEPEAAEPVASAEEQVTASLNS